VKLTTKIPPPQVVRAPRFKMPRLTMKRERVIFLLGFLCGFVVAVEWAKLLINHKL
jgi:hypothetical protein